MGLDIEVGGLGRSSAEDPELAGLLSRDLARLNAMLANSGLKPHSEPPSASPSDYFNCQMWGYYGLHYLRRIALYLKRDGALPAPGPASGDELFSDEFYALEAEYLRKWQENSYLPFSHLIVHSDADGIYLPQQFKDIFVLDPGGEVLGSHIGSSHTLLQECTQIAGHLRIPGDLDVESPELWEAVDTQGEGQILWRRYAIESFTCVRLMRACEISLRTGALVIFC